MPKIRIGTRESKLALWQARYVQSQLEAIGHQTELVLIKSEGELNLTQPLYELGVQGIFTKTLDLALLQNKIDIAVHSLKDVPTQIAEGLYHAAVPKRGNHLDLLVSRVGENLNMDEPLTIASSSLRRQAQWLNRYPHHHMEPIRGNINSRLQKLLDNKNWHATVLAAAGVERISLKAPEVQTLDWMLPAPSQGALGIFCRANDIQMKQICFNLNDEATFLCTYAERQYLRTLMGGCTMPIAAYATIAYGKMNFKGNVLSIDGKQKAEVEITVPLSEALEAGEIAATQIIEQGGKIILQQLKGARA